MLTRSGSRIGFGKGFLSVNDCGSGYSDIFQLHGSGHHPVSWIPAEHAENDVTCSDGEHQQMLTSSHGVTMKTAGCTHPRFTLKKIIIRK